MPLATCISIARQVCRGLAAAHAVGIVHRDLKPSNLFLVNRADAKPFVKILDFGVAKLSDGAQLTRTGMVVGTPAYMSPEQARGDKSVDERADVYSLGAVLYHMLTGRPPYSGGGSLEVLMRLAQESLVPPEQLDPKLPPALCKLVSAMLAAEPDERPQTMTEDGHRLRRLAHDLAPVKAAELTRQRQLMESCELSGRFRDAARIARELGLPEQVARYEALQAAAGARPARTESAAGAGAPNRAARSGQGAAPGAHAPIRRKKYRRRRRYGP
jgi:serine/threonine protein kinase